MLRELYAHQAWADAEHWRAIEAHAPALADKPIRDRLHHIHLVQHAFLWTCRGAGTSFALTKPEDFASMTALRDYGRAYHHDMACFLDELTPARLAETRVIPWFKDPPLSLPIEHALIQAAMHSHYHRGQNATRVRELGGEPPLTDFIVWIWKGRPDPQWPV